MVGDVVSREAVHDSLSLGDEVCELVRIGAPSNRTPHTI